MEKYTYPFYHHSFELEVINFIASKCSERETVTPYFFEMGKSNSFTADGYLPEGCETLKLAPKTIVEVKNKILPDTVSRWIRNIQTSFDGNQYNFLLVHNSSEVRDFWDIKIDGYNIDIISFDELKARDSKYQDINEEEINKTNDEKIDLNLQKRESKESQERIFESLKTLAKGGNITLFLGAGVSVSGGLPNWNTLLENIIREINPNQDPSILSDIHIEDIQKASNWSSIIMARYMRVGKDHPMEYNPTNKNGFNKALYRALYGTLGSYNDMPLINSIEKLISDGKVNSVITYNYDDYLETTLEKNNIPVQTIGNGERLTAGYFPIYHVHGFMPLDKNNPYIPNPVLTEESYHKLYQDAYQWSNVEQLHALNNSTCVFIGLSMTDPNIRRLMEISMMRNETDYIIAPHYVFLKKEKFHDGKSTAIEDEENREIIENMLHELGANVIWYDDHVDLPNLLDQL